MKNYRFYNISPDTSTATIVQINCWNQLLPFKMITRGINKLFYLQEDARQVLY